MNQTMMRLLGNLRTRAPLPPPWANVSLVYADIGARGGPPADWLKLSRHIDYVCFEPDPEESKALEVFFDQTAAFKGIVCRRALGAKRRAATLHLTSYRPSSSLLRPNEKVLRHLSVAEMFHVERTAEVEIGTLDAAMREIGKSCDFLKADVQGYELEVLRGAEETLRQVTGCELEVSFIEIYENQPLFAEVDQHMRARGFFLADLERFWWTRLAVPEEFQQRGSMAYGNALYLRHEILSPSTREAALRSGMVCLGAGLNELAYEILVNGADKGLLSRQETNDFQSWMSNCLRAERFWHRLSKRLANLPGRQTLGRWLGLWSRALQGVSNTGADSQSWLRRTSW